MEREWSALCGSRLPSGDKIPNLLLNRNWGELQSRSENVEKR